MQIHVSDTSGEIAKLLDSSMIEKYNISDEQYDQRSGEFFLQIIFCS